MVTMYRRKAPEVVDVGNDLFDWEEAMLRRMKPTLIDRLALMFKPWRRVIAPMDWPCCVTTMDGRPIYRYKEMGCAVFYLQPEPSPGFPGS